MARAPSDTRFRERLDALDPSHLRPLYKTLFAQLQRGKGLEGFAYPDDHYLISVDGTGYFILADDPLRAVRREAPSQRHHDLLLSTATFPDVSYPLNRHLS